MADTNPVHRAGLFRPFLLAIVLLAALAAVPSATAATKTPLWQYPATISHENVFGPICNPTVAFSQATDAPAAEFRAVEHVKGDGSVHYEGNQLIGWVESGSVTPPWRIASNSPPNDAAALEGTMASGTGDPYVVLSEAGYVMARMDAPVPDEPGSMDIAVHERNVDPPATPVGDDGFCLFGAADDSTSTTPPKPLDGEGGWYFIGAHIPGDDLEGHVDSGERHAFDLADRYRGPLPVRWILIVEAVSVTEQLKAAFQYTPAQPGAQQPVTFTDQSTVPNNAPATLKWSCEWSLSDPNWSGTVSPHVCVFPDKGTYTVCLEVTVTATLETNLGCQSVRVLNQRPVCSFIALLPPPGRSDVLFIDQSVDLDGQIEAWSWDFGDGSTPVSEPTPTHTFPAAGQYGVTLVVTDNGGAIASCTRQVTSEEPINRPPAVAPVRDLVVAAGRSFERQFTALDPDGDPLTFTIPVLPPGSAFDPGTRTLAGSPGAEDVGIYPVSLQVSDTKTVVESRFLVIVYLPGGDGDRDGVPDDGDNCAGKQNGNQADADEDHTGDACDPTPGLSEPGPVTPSDYDGDGLLDTEDNCRPVANPDQADRDQDGTGDRCDESPDDPAVRAVRIPRPDQDGDSILDGADNCPATRNPAQTDLDGDGTGDACDDDVDGDRVPDQSADLYAALDNCPYRFNGAQVDRDADGLGDVCDPYPDVVGEPAGLQECPAPCPQPYTPEERTWVEVYRENYRVAVIVGSFLFVAVGAGVILALLAWARPPKAP